jgi:ribose 5-phosphate isomerase A
MTVEQLKLDAATHAVRMIESGMVVGLGHGSTALLAVQMLAERIPMGTLEQHPVIDLTIDGADEVDPELNLIKGGGGALLREKIVAQASRRLIIIADESKLSPKLGTKWAVPVEVIPFGWTAQARFIESLGAQVKPRVWNGEMFQTVNGNMILDCAFGPIDDPERLAGMLKARTGIVEHGLFVGMASTVVVAGMGGTKVLNATRNQSS